MIHITKCSAYSSIGYTCKKITIKSDCEWSLRCILLIDVWLLADRIMVPRLQNEALELLENAKRRDRKLLPPQYHQNTARDSPLRACIVRMWPDLTISSSQPFPRELLVDLFNRPGPMKHELERKQDTLDSSGDIFGHLRRGRRNGS